MINFSYTFPSSMSNKLENNSMIPSIDILNYYLDSACQVQDQVQDLIVSAILSIIFVVSIFGLLGNGTVIWLLGFRMKRNPFTTYILNLAVADFGVLISLFFMVSIYFCLSHGSTWQSAYGVVISIHFSHFAYSTSQILLATISVDRCVSVVLPLWYRCHRPENLSTVLCTLIWLLSVLQGIFKVIFPMIINSDPYFFVLLLNSVVCLTVITVSTLILFVRFCIKSQQRRRGKLLMAILLTLLFFLIFAFPLNVIYLIRTSSHHYFHKTVCYQMLEWSFVCAALNSFVNPLLYFLVGRKKRGLCRESLQLILRRVFMEEEEACREEPGIQL